MLEYLSRSNLMAVREKKNRDSRDQLERERTGKPSKARLGGRAMVFSCRQL